MALTQITIYHLENFTTTASTVDNMLTASNDNSDSFNVITATGQVIATGASMVPAASPIAILANGTVSYMYAVKITGDFSRNDFNVGDVINIIGAASGLALAITVFVPIAPVAAATLAALSISANFASVWNSSNIDIIKNFALEFFNKTDAHHTPGDGWNYYGLYITPVGTFAPREALIMNYNDNCLVLKADDPNNPLMREYMNFVEAYKPFAHWDIFGVPNFDYIGGPFASGGGMGYLDPILYPSCTDLCDNWYQDSDAGWTCAAQSC